MNNFTTIEQYISSPRLSRYMQISSNETEKALKLYQTNIRISQSFYPLLSLLEVILRNSLNKVLTAYFKDRQWLINQQNMFMSNSCFAPKFYIRTEVESRIRKLTADNKPITNDNIIAGLTLGFWVSFFNPQAFQLLKGEPLKILTNKPTSVNGTIFNKKLGRIRDFRNKVYHNEPIIFSNSSNGDLIFTISHAENIYNDIKQIFSYFDLDFKKWTRRIDNIPLEFKRASIVYNFYPYKRYYYHRLKVGVLHLQYKYSSN